MLEAGFRPMKVGLPADYRLLARPPASWRALPVRYVLWRSALMSRWRQKGTGPA